MARKLSPEKKAAKEAEKQRKAEEKAEKKAAKEAEKQRKAEEKAEKKAAKEAEKQRKAEEKAEKEAKMIKIGFLDTNKNLNSFNILGFVSSIKLFQTKVNEEKLNQLGTSAGIIYQRLLSINNIDNVAYSNKGKILSPSGLTICQKSGLCDSNLRLTSLGEALSRQIIQIEEYALILLSKQWITQGNDIKGHVLTLLYNVLQKGPLPYSNAQFTESLISGINDYSVEIEKGLRLEFLRELLITTNLVNVVPQEGAVNIENEESLDTEIQNEEDNQDSSNVLCIKIDSNRENIWKDIIDRIDQLVHPEKVNTANNTFYEYLGNINRGIVELVDSNNYILYQPYYPNLYKLKTEGYLLIEYPQGWNGKHAQIIYYGAPGTGKSNEIKNIISVH